MSSIKMNTVKFGTEATGSTGVTAEQEAYAQSLIEELSEAKQNLNSSSEYYEYLSLEEQAKIESMKARIDGQIALLETFLETGVWNGGVGESGDFYENLPDIEDGWNGDMEWMDESSEAYQEYYSKVNEPGQDTGTLEGVIMVPNSGVQSYDSLYDSAIGFKVGDDIVKVEGKTVGDDIWITTTDKDGEKKTYVLKGLATRTDVQIYIYGGECEQDLIMDMSRVIRASGDNSTYNPFGSSANGMWLIGGSGNDIIIGSQSDDHIVGNLGDDKLYGSAGMDHINGDQYYIDPSYSPGVGGNDFIDGGLDNDVVFAGGGADDTVVTDVHNPNEATMVYEEEKSADYNVGSESEITGAVNMYGWESAGYDAETGEYTIEKTAGSSDNTIEINTPEGYSMAYAKNDGDDIVVTFVKTEYDADGNPKDPVYLTLRIRGAADSSNQSEIIMKANSKSTIIDWRNCYTNGNHITLLGNSGDDSILGPQTNLDKYMIEADELDEGSSLSDTKLDGIIEDKTVDGDCTWGGDYWHGDATAANGEIVLDTLDGTSNEELNFTAPDGFDVDAVFYETTPEGDLIVYMIDVHEDGSHDRIKIRIKDGAEAFDLDKIKVTNESGEAITATPMGYTSIDGATGSDLLFGSKGSVIDWGTEDPNDSKVDGFMAPSNPYVDQNDDEISQSSSTVPEDMCGVDSGYATEDGTALDWDDEAPGSEEGLTVYEMRFKEEKDPVTGDDL